MWKSGKVKVEKKQINNHTYMKQTFYAELDKQKPLNMKNKPSVCQ